MMTLAMIKRAIGGDISGDQVLAPGPGHSRSDRSLAVKIGATGKLVVTSFAGDDQMACLQFVEQKLGMAWQPESGRQRQSQMPASQNDNAERTRSALSIWSSAKDPRGTIVEAYLASRGLALPDDMAGSVIRFHPSCPFGKGGVRHPCMVAAFHSIETGEFVAIHRTALTPDGRKIDRKMMGPAGGAAIKLDPGDGAAALAIGEGIESCLSARVMGFAPVWALGSALGIEKFPVLPGVEQLLILGENDATGTNARAAQAVGERWHAAGREVVIATSPEGNDLNDALQSMGQEAAAIITPFAPAPKPASRGALLARQDGGAVAGQVQEVDDGTITQDGLALLFARQYAGKLRFCHHAGTWFEWRGTHWQRDETELAFHFVRELGRQFTQGAAIEDLKAVRKVTFAGGVEKFARSDRALAVTSDHWDRDPFLLGTPGGTVDLRTGLMREPDQADGITKLTAVAPSASADCARWFQFLNETFGGDAEIIRFVQQWTGYSLTADTSEHALVFGFGSGGNGKSVFLNAVTGIMADYAATASMDTFTASQSERHPTDLAMLRGARLVTASETEEGRAWAESRIKQMTGGDPITARFMRQDFFTFRPSFKLTIIGNHRPVLKSVDDAARRRFNLVPFLLKPANPDRHLEEKLKAEWPGILRWMIEGCLDWQANGLIRPKSVIAATQAYFAEQDVIGQWLDDECDADPGNNWWEAGSTALYVSWTDFAHKAGENPGTQKALSGILLKRGFEKCTIGHAGLKGFRGIRLKQKGGRDEE